MTLVANQSEKLEAKKAEWRADRPRLAAHLMHVVNDASDYQNDFMVPLTRSEIYAIYYALKDRSDAA